MDNDMNFSEALKALKMGSKVTRFGWDGKGMYLELQLPNEKSKMTLPYIFLKTVDGALVPWTASQADLLSEDWVLVVDS